MLADKKKSKLDKLKMPEKRADEEMDMLELSEESPEMEAAEGEEMAEMGAEEAAPEAEPSALEAVSDDELVAEMKKRGLKLDEAGDAPAAEDDQEIYS